MTDLGIRRLDENDSDRARELFALLAAIFDEEGQTLDRADLVRLLGSKSFWALAAVENNEVIGGLTAHALPMTRTPTSELFIYDIAVRVEDQRKGVGRKLVAALCKMAAASGIATIFVAADNLDAHALDFYRALGGAAQPVTMFSFAASS